VGGNVLRSVSSLVSSPSSSHHRQLRSDTMVSNVSSAFAAVAPTPLADLQASQQPFDMSGASESTGPSRPPVRRGGSSKVSGSHPSSFQKIKIGVKNRIAKTNISSFSCPDQGPGRLAARLC